ncbi:site-specific integrase [Hyphomonas sp. KY3]|uniref:tyrosine-type recombinase/integrase n=1 Tax=Hyphomonas sp. KY3 TaxID=2016196 RepID=UPI001A90B7C7|nr:site-specific integrase [Hyphomonas sp. KY3]
MGKLTKKTIDAARAESKEHFLWDSELRGFGLRISPKGKKTFIVQYRKGGRTCRMSLGPYGTLTPDEGRRLAKHTLGNVAMGDDPALERRIERKAPNMAALCDRYVQDHVMVRCRPSTQYEHKRVCEFYIKPRLGTFKVQDVSRADIAELHQSLYKIPYQANRVVMILSKMFNLAELWGLRADGSNPCRHVKKYAERKRERFLSPEEIETLWAVLDRRVLEGLETAHVASAFRLLLLTGCRLREIQHLRWTYIVGDAAFLPDTKTGPRRLLLSKAALEELRRIERIDGNPYVIVGKVPGQAITDLQRPWRRIREEAGLSDVRIHDLRHTYASIAAMAGHSLTMIGKLLGHTQAQTTARYAHLADQTTRRALEDVDGMICRFTGSSPEPDTLSANRSMLKAANDGG